MYRQYVSSKVMPVKITHFKYNIARVFSFFVVVENATIVTY